MDKLTARVELRLSADTFATLLEIEKQHQLSPQVVTRALADAAADYYRKNGRFGFPIHLSEGPITPTSPVKIETRDNKPALPHEKTRPPGKKLSPEQQAGRRFNSAGRGKQMVETGKLHARVQGQAATAAKA